MKSTGDKVTVSLVVLGLLSSTLLISGCAKQNAPQPQPEDPRAGAATETHSAPAAPSSTAAAPVASAPQPTEPTPAPSAAPATGQGGSATAAPASKAAPTPSAKPAASTAAKSPTAPAAAPTEASAKPAVSATYTGDNPCVATSFKFAAVRNACEHGGRPEVKSLMKSMTKKAEAAGTELKCNSCHTSLKTYELKDNAVADLRKWL